MDRLEKSRHTERDWLEGNDSRTEQDRREDDAGTRADLIAEALEAVSRWRSDHHVRPDCHSWVDRVELLAVALAEADGQLKTAADTWRELAQHLPAEWDGGELGYLVSDMDAALAAIRQEEKP